MFSFKTSHRLCFAYREGLALTPRKMHTTSINSSFSFIVAHDFRAKRRIPSKRLKKNRPNSGEDSFFYSRSSKASAMGVADGVGGWSEIGADSSELSQALCDGMKDQFVSRVNSLVPTPEDLISSAYANIIDEDVVKAGGTTACVAVANAVSGVLKTANLGDSGFIVFRSGKIVTQSIPQTHAFNTPYQLAVLPPEIRRREAMLSQSSGRHIADSPRDADLRSFELKHGDLVVLCTDGFSDNISSTEALSIVTEWLLKAKVWHKDPQLGINPCLDTLPTESGMEIIASRLVSSAYTAAHDRHRMTPFAKEIQRELKISYSGGKVDDITVVVFYVAETVKSSL